MNFFLSRNEKGEHISNIKLPDGSSLTDPSDIANHLNSHFAGVGQKMAACVNDNGVPPEYYMTPTNSTFSLKTTTADIVAEIMNKMSTNKATGLDGISSKILKVSSLVVAPALTYVFNKAIVRGIFPDEWKIARVSSLHKVGAILIIIDQFPYYRSFPKFLKGSCMTNSITICVQMT